MRKAKAAAAAAASKSFSLKRLVGLGGSRDSAADTQAAGSTHSVSASGRDSLHSAPSMDESKDTAHTKKGSHRHSLDRASDPRLTDSGSGSDVDGDAGCTDDSEQEDDEDYKKGTYPASAC